ncbi:MAG: hypothetical protein MZV63_63040 [Marinilabiliales bacterium]|nr:hypothetical protein [Marinilabiliales bacterium]
MSPRVAPRGGPVRRFAPVLAPVLLAIIAFGATVPAAAQGPGPFDKFSRVSGPTADPAAPVEYQGHFSGYTNYWQSISPALGTVRKPLPHRPARCSPGHRPEQGRHRRGDRSPRPRPRRGLPRGPGSDRRRPSSRIRTPGRSAPRSIKATSWPGSAGTGLGADLLGRAQFPEGTRDVKASHQARARGFREVSAFVLSNGARQLFTVVADLPEGRRRFKELLTGLRDVVDRYDFHRGWFGTGTLLHSVTCHPGHPLEVIGQGLGQGNDWFSFSGYMDFLMLKQLPEWLSKVGSGHSRSTSGRARPRAAMGTVAYGLKSYDGFKIQDMPTEEEWIEFVKDRGGHIFRPVFAPDCDQVHVRRADRRRRQQEADRHRGRPVHPADRPHQGRSPGLHGPLRGKGTAMDPGRDVAGHPGPAGRRGPAARADDGPGRGSATPCRCFFSIASISKTSLPTRSGWKPGSRTTCSTSGSAISAARRSEGRLKCGRRRRSRSTPG